VKALGDKEVTIGNGKKFSLDFKGKNVNICSHTTGVDITSGTNFATLLKCVAALKGEGKAIGNDFTIKIAVATSDIQLGGVKIDQTFMKTENFWGAVKGHKVLFDKLPIEVSKVESSKKVKIGDTELDFEVLGKESGNIVSDWSGIFTLN
jgi:hypothetical protein